MRLSFSTEKKHIVYFVHIISVFTHMLTHYLKVRIVIETKFDRFEFYREFFHFFYFFVR